MAAVKSRSRSPKPRAVAEPELPSVSHDVDATQKIRLAYTAPKQSKFRVAALLRFTRPDGSQGTIGGTNAEPHDANIRGAICAERLALGVFQREEAAKGSKIRRVVCATDCDAPIYPGPLCREFLTSLCDADTEVVAAGANGDVATQPLRALLPIPSLYRRGDQDSMTALGERLGAAAGPPPEDLMLGLPEGSLGRAYAAAVAKARRQLKQKAVFPVCFAAAVCFEDGRVHSVCELKGIEYGCTVDAVSLLLPELLRSREEQLRAVCVVQVDQHGLGHAPFAAARSLLVEHGFGHVAVCGQAEDGSWLACSCKEALPHCNFLEIF